MSTPLKKMPEKDSFILSDENIKKAKKLIAKYPENRSRSALKSILDLAQRQNGGWLSKGAIEHVADFMNLPLIQVQEVASFYTMFNLKPVGKFHVQVCGTTPCWLCNAEGIKKTCEDKLGVSSGETTKDNLFTLSEVECVGACVNAPVVKINDDYYEDLSSDNMVQILDDLKAGKKPKIGTYKNRQTSKAEGA